MSEKRQLAGVCQVGFERFDHALREGGLVLRCMAFAVADTLEGGNQLVDACGGGFVARGVGGAVPDGRRCPAAALAVPVACRDGMPAVRRDGDPQFSVPGFLAVKVDSDGFVTLEGAAVVAIGATPQGLEFALILAGT